MKYVFALALAVLGVGCAADPEDKPFFNAGWVHPEKGANQRLASPTSMSAVRNEYDLHPE